MKQRTLLSFFGGGSSTTAVKKGKENDSVKHNPMTTGALVQGMKNDEPSPKKRKIVAPAGVMVCDALRKKKAERESSGMSLNVLQVPENIALKDVHPSTPKNFFEEDDDEEFSPGRPLRRRCRLKRIKYLDDDDEMEVFEFIPEGKHALEEKEKKGNRRPRKKDDDDEEFAPLHASDDDSVDQCAQMEEEEEEEEEESLTRKRKRSSEPVSRRNKYVLLTAFSFLLVFMNIFINFFLIDHFRCGFSRVALS